MTSTNNHADTAATIIAKASPPVYVSIATISGYQISDLILWATLIYTLLMIAHKLAQMWSDFKKKYKNGSK